MNCRGIWVVAISVVPAVCWAGEVSGPLRLPDTFPIPMAFRPLESGDPIERLAPFPIVHAGPVDEIKRRWPEKICILHRPYAALHRNLVDARRHRSVRVWPGHFLYWTGSMIAGDVPADASAMRIPVEHPERFQTDTPNKLGVPDDVAIYRLDESGKPDWSHCEYAIVTDVGRDDIEVQRGQYGTQPLMFQTGHAAVATHAQYCGDNTGVRSWSLNLSLHCPKSPEGLTAAEWAARYWAEELHEKHPAADGIEFDVGAWRHTLFRRPVDCNNDLIPDYGTIDGVNSFGLGGQIFVRELRQRLGPNKIIQVDSSGAASGFRGWKYINGIEMESFPSGSHFERFSPAFEHLRHWSAKAEAQPRFSYGFTKIATTVYGDKYLARPSAATHVGDTCRVSQVGDACRASLGRTDRPNIARDRRTRQVRPTWVSLLRANMSHPADATHQDAHALRAFSRTQNAPERRKTDFRFRVGLAAALIVGMPHPYAALDEGHGEVSLSCSGDQFRIDCHNTGKWRQAEFPISQAHFDANSRDADLIVRCVQESVVLHMIEIER